VRSLQGGAQGGVQRAARGVIAGPPSFARYDVASTMTEVSELTEAPIAGFPDDRFINRELSWLDFGSRLLDLAADDDLALLERAKFLAIFADGLDEFFQVRVAGLEDQVAADLRTRSPDGLRPADQLEAITARVASLADRQGEIFAGQIVPALAGAGVVLSDWHTLDDDDRAYLVDVFNRQIFPVLTPLAVDPGHPFPYISNLSLNLVVRVVDPGTKQARIARVKVPPLLPRFVVLPDGERFVPLEQVIAAHLGTLFPSMIIAEQYVFRVTRNADLAVEEDEADDLLAAVETELQRRRFGQAVRLEAAGDITDELLEMLVSEMDVPESNVYLVDTPIDLSGLWAVVGLPRPDLAAPQWSPVTATAFRRESEGNVFEVIAARDVLLHHPYDSFVTSIEAFIEQAARDPEVQAIKQTFYRTSGDSPIVASLIRASRAGKQVVAVVELQARFDEQANIAWARAMEEAGVQVVYGLVGLKTHTKMALVVRSEGGIARRYCHLSTGNYNSRTARYFEDLGLLTADEEVGLDMSELFNVLTGSGPPAEFRRLAVAPISLRAHLLTLIAEEAAAGGSGRIAIKANAITDPEIIDALYRASQAGAVVDLVVRSRCCLRAGVPGLSDRIRVRSIVGRYLEHSRIFLFGGVDGRRRWVGFGSADLMERNLDRRVEALLRVDDPTVADRLTEVLDAAFRDEVNSWELQPDGTWARVAHGAGSFGLQEHMWHLATTRRGATMAPGATTAPGAAGQLTAAPDRIGSVMQASIPAPRWWRRLAWWPGRSADRP
jgi:polyphosphate kinase